MYENYFRIWLGFDDHIYVFDEPQLRPLRTIGKTRRATIYKKHIYYHCRSMLR